MTTPSQEKDQPLISVIMAAYCAANFIKETMESVLEQTYRNLEIIVIDDASPDGTAVVAAGVRDARVRLVRLPSRLGRPSAVRNVGLRQARGEFVAFLDHDDLYLPDALRKLSSPMIEDPKIFATFGLAKFIDEGGRSLPLTQSILGSARRGGSRYFCDWGSILRIRQTLYLQALMVRKSVLDAMGPLTQSFSVADDRKLYLDLLRRDLAGVMPIQDYVFKYRIHGTNTSRRPDKLRNQAADDLRLLREFYKSPNIPPAAAELRAAAFAARHRVSISRALKAGQWRLAASFLWDAWIDENVSAPDLVLDLCGWLIHGAMARMSP